MSNCIHPNPEIGALLQRLHHPSLKAISPGLERVERLLAALGNPEQKLPPIIHIAGTNGKGSVCAYLTAMLQQTGLKVHLYTSPHLVQFNERIMVAGKEISDEALQHYLAQVSKLLEVHPVTFFEATTVAAFLAFADTPGDVCILETGMGGRLDATNVIENPLLTIITSISMDHMEYLGSTLEQIAREKAGIMKSGVPCIIGPQATAARMQLKNTAQQMHTPLWVYGEHWHLRDRQYVSKTFTFPLMPSLPGEHQYVNAAIALAAGEMLCSLAPQWQLDMQPMAQAIGYAHHPARLQPLNDTTWLDGGHNEDAAKALAHWLNHQPSPRVVICGMLETKDANAFIRQFHGHCEYMICIDQFGDAPNQPKEMLAQYAASASIPVQIADNIHNALQQAAQYKPATILICGSLYLAGEILKAGISPAGT